MKIKFLLILLIFSSSGFSHSLKTDDLKTLNGFLYDPSSEEDKIDCSIDLKFESISFNNHKISYIIKVKIPEGLDPSDIDFDEDDYFNLQLLDSLGFSILSDEIYLKSNSRVKGGKIITYHSRPITKKEFHQISKFDLLFYD